MTRRNTLCIALTLLLFAALAAAPAAAQELGLPGEDDFGSGNVIKTTVHTPKAFAKTFCVQVDFVLNSGAIHVYRDQAMEFAPTKKLTGAKFLKIAFPEGEDWHGQTVFRNKFSLKLFFELTGEAGSAVEIAGTLSYQGCEDDDSSCYFEKTAIDIGGVADPTAEPVTPPDDKQPQNGVKPVDPDNKPAEKPVLESTQAETVGEDLTKSQENWFDSLGVIPFVIMSFVVGLGLSITPCVYPLIPITSGIVKSFGKPTKSGAIVATLIYIFGLVVVYAAVGTISALAGNTVSGILTSPYVLGLLAAIMVVLALSMFGLYELKLPDKFTGRIQQATTRTRHNKTGLLLMGMLSGCIAGPCVSGPLAAVLMSITARADILVGFLSMSAVAIGMSALLFLAGAFNATLPKAGPWMRKVNMTFGFMLLIMAVYFVRDLVGAAVFILVTGLLIFMWTVFVGAWDALTAESGVAARVVKVVGLLAAVIGVLLALNGFIDLSGFKPFGEDERLERIELQLRGMQTGIDIEDIREGQFREATMADVEAALKSGKPVILDFYGDNCSSCDALAEKFEHPDVVMALRNFETLRIHNTRNPELALQYQVGNKIPIVVFIDSKGRRLQGLRMSGNSETVEQILEKIRQCEAHK